MIAVCNHCNEQIDTQTCFSGTIHWCDICKEYYCNKCCSNTEEIKVIDHLSNEEILIRAIHPEGKQECGSFFFDASDDVLAQMIERWRGNTEDQYIVSAKKLLQKQKRAPQNGEKKVMKKEKREQPVASELDGDLKFLDAMLQRASNEIERQEILLQVQEQNPKVYDGYIKRVKLEKEWDTFMQEGKSAREENRFEDAENAFLSALEVSKKIYKEHYRYSLPLHQMGMLYKAIGNYERSEESYLQAKKIAYKLLGENHDLSIAIISELGNLYRYMGRYDEAENLVLKVKEKQEKTGNIFNATYAHSLNELALICYQKVNFIEAKSLFVQAEEIYKLIFGEDHFEYAICLNNFAELYNAMGEYSKAEIYFLKAKSIFEDNFSQNTLKYAGIVGNLASIYYAMKEYKKAESFYLKSKEVMGGLLDQNHPMYFQALCNLAYFYCNIDKYNEAEPLCLEAKSIMDKNDFLKETKYALIFRLMANFYHAKSEYTKAEQYYREMIRFYEHSPKQHYQEYGETLISFASLCYTIGQYDEAKVLCSKAKVIWEETLGQNHRNYAICLQSLATIEIKLNNAYSALSYLLEASKIHDKLIQQMSAISDENRLIEYISTFKDEYFGLISLFCQYYNEVSKMAPHVFDFILKRKSLINELLARRRDSILSSQHPELQKQFDELLEVTREIAKLLMETTQHIDPDANQIKIQSLEERKKILEKTLAQEIPEIELKQKLDSVSTQSICSLLPAQSALIEIIYLREADLAKMNYQGNKYIAFILRQDSPQKIEFVELGASEEIDQTITLYKIEIERHLDDLTELSGRKVGVVIKSKEEMTKEKYVRSYELWSQQLYLKIFAPILAKINDIKRLIISPDGFLNLFPFEVLEQPNGRFVIEDYEISYVDSGKNILRFSDQTKAKNKPIIVVDPDYDLKGIDTNKAESKNSLAPKNRLCERLEDTAKEGKAIATLLHDNCELWTREKVLDASLKKIESPQIFHISTHGFFLEDYHCTGAELGDKALEESFFRIALGNTDKEKIFQSKHVPNPLLRVGLALAGINTFIQEKITSHSAEDGILTALDITGMNFIGTDLVVLSACETGRGEVKLGDNFYSFRHAFTIAGAKTLVMTMWSVLDKEGMEIMVSFYRKILQGTEKAYALRESQREFIQKCRDIGKYPFPCLWGSFVCFGDPGKLKIQSH